MMKKLSVSICIPAYNEERNITYLLQELLKQNTKNIYINKIIVISSECTDRTDEIVSEFAKNNSSISLIKEGKRNGKASAINLFLKEVNDPILVIQSSDTIPDTNTIELLCTPFIHDPEIGMTGGAPYPLNNPETCIGYIVHTWWWFHRNIPRFGEIIAYRNIIGKLSEQTAVDEAFIQAKIIQKGLKVVHVNEAIVKNKGATNFKDLISQRRRVFNGHARLYVDEKIHIDGMTKATIKLLFLKYKIHGFKQLVWLLMGIGIEVYAQVLGAYDMRIKKINPVAWEIANSTKRLIKNNV